MWRWLALRWPGPTAASQWRSPSGAAHTSGASEMRKPQWWVIASAVLSIAVIALALVRRGAETSQGSPPRGAQAARGQASAPIVAVGHLVPMDIATTLSLTATVVSLRETSMFSRVSGYLETVTVRPGDTVRPGEIVAVVEHSQLDAQVRSAVGARSKAGADLGRARAGVYTTTSGGTPILSIDDRDNVAVLVNVTEADMGALRRGAKAEIGVDAFPNRMFHGTVARIAGGVDPDSRTVQVEVELDNSDHALRPGMYARVRLAGAARRTFVVPLSALVIVGGQQFVWVVADGKVSQRAVTIGSTTASVVEITSGVKPGETIVFRGTEQVREGGAVRTAPAGE